MTEKQKHAIRHRFGGLMPVVIDVETGGLHWETDALLEIAAINIKMNDDGFLTPDDTFSTHVVPFEGSIMNPKSMEINKIDPYHPFRFAISEQDMLNELFQYVEKELKLTQCRRAVLVGHNASFDLNFLLAACKRCKVKNNPFHSFTCIDTATLGGFIYGRTVLAKVMKAAALPFDVDEAHSAVYDCEATAQLFCKMVNDYAGFP